MYTVSKEILYYEHSKNNPPTNKIKPKTWFKVETQMNRGPDLSKIPSNLREIYNNYRSDSQPTDKGNPSSGCIYIEDTKPGDVLIIHIGKIKTHPIGWTRYKGSTGAMPNYLGFSNLGEQFRVCEITENKIIWDNHTNFPVEPMIGVLGGAPEYESRTNAWGGVWGRNMDIQEVTTGAKITLPIFHTGALLHVGDMHARQGDGEICGGGGIETGGSVELFVETQKKPKKMTWPRIENSSHIMTYCFIFFTGQKCKFLRHYYFIDILLKPLKCPFCHAHSFGFFYKFLELFFSLFSSWFAHKIIRL